MKNQLIIVVKIFFFPYLEQLETSMLGPSQFLPPHRGAGLSQDLERHKQELTPSTPSSLLQGCHGAQVPKPPLVVWLRSWKTNVSKRELGLTQPFDTQRSEFIVQVVLELCCQTGLLLLRWRESFQRIKGEYIYCNSLHFSQIQSSWS